MNNQNILSQIIRSPAISSLAKLYAKHGLLLETFPRIKRNCVSADENSGYKLYPRKLFINTNYSLSNCSSLFLVISVSDEKEEERKKGKEKEKERATLEVFHLAARFVIRLESRQNDLVFSLFFLNLSTRERVTLNV